MKRLLPVHVVVALYLSIPAYATSQTLTGDQPASLRIAPDIKHPDGYAGLVPNDPTIPGKMLDVMRTSQLRYQEELPGHTGPEPLLSGFDSTDTEGRVSIPQSE